MEDLSLEDIAMGKRVKKADKISAATAKELKQIKAIKDLVESKSVKSVKALKDIDRKMLRKAYSRLREALSVGQDVIRGANENMYAVSAC